MLRLLLALALVSLPLRAEIVVSAAASLEAVLLEAAAAWEAQSGQTVRLNVGASHSLALQIAAGAPADLFVSAATADVDLLHAKRLIVPASRTALAANTLVVIVPRRSALVLRDARGLSSPSVRHIALPDVESSPAGIRAKRYLERAGAWASVGPRVIPASDVRGALAMVASGAADAGIVYRTDAAASPGVRIAFVPEIERIRYDAALIRHRRADAHAGSFLRFLASPAGKEIFQKHGFILP